MVIDMTNFGGVSGEKLRQIVARIEKLEEEKQEISECISETYSEAKAFGFIPKILRHLIKIRKMNKDDLQEQESVLDVYMHAMGMAGEPESDNEEQQAVDELIKKAEGNDPLVLDEEDLSDL